MGDRGASSVPFTTRLTDFDDALIKRDICSREQCLLAKGMTQDQVNDLLVAEEVEARTRDAEAAARDAVEDRDARRLELAAAAASSEKELDELDEDDEFMDDGFLAKYREARVAELKAAAAKKLFGEVVEISRDQWPREVNAASEQCWVFVHLYQDHVPDCVALGRVLEALAKRHAAVKFVKIRATAAVEAWPDANLPAAYVYEGGEMRHQLVGSRAISAGPPPFDESSVERRLVELGIVAAADADADRLPPAPPSAAPTARRGAYAAEADATWDA